MLFGFFGSLLNSTVAYAYPAYASFKSLSRRPASEPELERWLMYWSVVGCVVALEYVAEWTISWIPFYWFMKTVFLLWLALPQTQGATYMYRAHLAPLLTTYEPAIDAHLGQYKARAYGFIHAQFETLWKHITALIAQHTGINLNAVDPAASPSTGAAQGSSQPQNLGHAATVVLGLWTTWGPTITNALRPPTAPEPAPQQQASAFIPPSRPTASTTSSGQSNIDTIRARRREIEAELARLAALEQQHGSSSPDLVNIPSSSNLNKSMYLSEPGSATPSEASLDTNVRAIRDSGRYEEIQREELEDEDSDAGSATRPPNPPRWSFWGRSNSDYTPLKEE